MANKLFSRLSFISLLGAAFATAGLFLLITGLVRTARTTKITPISDLLEFSEGTYVSGDAIDILYGTPMTNNVIAEHSRPIVYETYSPLAIDPLEFYDGYLIKVSGKLCPLFISSKSEIYEAITSNDRTSPKPFVGVVTQSHCENFENYVTTILPKFYYEIDGDREYHFSESDCSELGIRVVDIQKERLTFLWGLPLLIIGLLILWREGAFHRVTHRQITQLMELDTSESSGL